MDSPSASHVILTPAMHASSSLETEAGAIPWTVEVIGAGWHH